MLQAYENEKSPYQTQIDQYVNKVLKKKKKRYEYNKNSPILLQTLLRIYTSMALKCLCLPDEGIPKKKKKSAANEQVS